MLKALPSLFPNLLGATDSARVEFYDKFRQEVDDHDHEFTKNYDKDLNTTLIFVGIFFVFTSVAIFIWFFWRNRPVYSLQSHRFFLSTSRASSNRTSKK